MDLFLLLPIVLVIGFYILAARFRDRIAGHPAIIAFLIAAVIWMIYETITAPDGQRTYKIMLTLIYAYGAWSNWRTRRERRAVA